MKTKKLVSCPQCGGFGFTSTPASTDYEITVCRAKTCELCHGAGAIEVPMTNADCPMCCDFCPVVDVPGVCRFEDRGDPQ